MKLNHQLDYNPLSFSSFQMLHVKIKAFFKDPMHALGGYHDFINRIATIWGELLLNENEYTITCPE